MASTPFSKLYDVEVVGGDQRTRLAELLRSQGLNQPQGQMVSGWYVPPSWSQNLNSALQLGLGTYMGIKGEEEDRKNLQEDIQRFTAAQQAQGLRKAGQPTTPAQQATDSAYPSTPAQGQVQEGQFRAMKTGGPEGMQSVPSYSMAQSQPQIDPYDVEQYKSPRFQRMLQQQQLERLTAVPEYGTTPVKTAQGMALVSKSGDLKYLTDSQGKPLYSETDLNDLVVRNPQTGQPEINPLALKAKSMVSRAGAPNVSVNTGQRGFDNTLKLRSDFRSEPIYKGFQEVKSAYDQVKESAKLASPAGDLAAATKVMKILDPGSVVRESELGLALSASGLGDRVGNYANMVITGQKLTPAQRKDFLNLSEQLYNASANQYNAKRGEYAGISERNQLNTVDVVGAPAQVQKQVVRRGKLGDKTVVEYSDGTIEYGK
jgi:hypothetical protein